MGSGAVTISAAVVMVTCVVRCGTGKHPDHPVAPSKPIEQVFMEPIVIEAYEEAGELKFVSYDAEGLFDEGLKHLSAGSPETAVKFFEKILGTFPDTKFKSATLFNAAFCYEEISMKVEKEKNLRRAIELYDRLILEVPDSPDLIDASFRKGYCLEELGEIDKAIKHYEALLAMKGMGSKDKIEAKTRIGNLLLRKNDLAKAEKVLREVILFFNDVSAEERIDNTYYVAEAQFQVAEIYRIRFEAITFSTQESKIREELEKKLELMAKAKDAYVATIKIGNYHWATAAGYRIGMLFKTLHDQILGAPLPPVLTTDELREIYLEMLSEKVAPLLRSALSIWEKTLIMAERVGYSGEWVGKVENAIEETSKLTVPFAP